MKRAQGHFLSSCSRRGAFAQKNHDDLFVSILAIREIRLTAVRKNRQLFLQLLDSIGYSIGINDIVVQNKMGGGEGVLEMVTKEEIVTK
jgi:hypothetical protein